VFERGGVAIASNQAVFGYATYEQNGRVTLSMCGAGPNPTATFTSAMTAAAPVTNAPLDNDAFAQLQPVTTMLVSERTIMHVYPTTSLMGGMLALALNTCSLDQLCASSTSSRFDLSMGAIVSPSFSQDAATVHLAYWRYDAAGADLVLHTCDKKKGCVTASDFGNPVVLTSLQGVTINELVVDLAQSEAGELNVLYRRLSRPETNLLLCRAPATCDDPAAFVPAIFSGVSETLAMPSFVYRATDWWAATTLGNGNVSMRTPQLFAPFNTEVVPRLGGAQVKWRSDGAVDGYLMQSGDQEIAISDPGATIAQTVFNDERRIYLRSAKDGLRGEPSRKVTVRPLIEVTAFSATGNTFSTMAVNANHQVALTRSASNTYEVAHCAGTSCGTGADWARFTLTPQIDVGAPPSLLATPRAVYIAGATPTTRELNLFRCENSADCSNPNDWTATTGYVGATGSYSQYLSLVSNESQLLLTHCGYPTNASCFVQTCAESTADCSDRSQWSAPGLLSLSPSTHVSGVGIPDGFVLFNHGSNNVAINGCNNGDCGQAANWTGWQNIAVANIVTASVPTQLQKNTFHLLMIASGRLIASTCSGTACFAAGANTASYWSSVQVDLANPVTFLKSAVIGERVHVIYAGTTNDIRLASCAHDCHERLNWMTGTILDNAAPLSLGQRGPLAVGSDGSLLFSFVTSQGLARLFYNGLLSL
jgi:hypothetical protein